MKWFERIMIILGMVTMVLYFMAVIILLVNIIYWPIWWLFELYGGIL